MISPNDIELLIFDLDGTIFQSDKANLEAIKKALSQMNLNVQISEEDVKKHLGESSEEFYKNILPPDKASLWQEVRTKVREEYNYSLRNFGCVFPDVVETLELLKKREYKLALFSNCSVQYLRAAISTLNIKDCFDYAECSQENDLTKIELVQEIKDKFQGLEAAVVGDRIHDIEAATENNALSIGALYGYNGKEAELADITINKFSQLLGIFDRRLPIFEKILEEIQEKPKDKTFVVGISGIDISGKTKFTEAFEKFLISEGYKTQTINLDDFHHPKKIRYSGENQAENYYNRSFDIKTIVEKLLIPIHQKSNLSIRLSLLDLYTDEYEAEKEFAFDQDTIVLFEGVFLFRKDLSPYIDYKIFIEIPFEESKNRAGVRDVPIYGKEVLSRYDEKYLPAQRKYLAEFPPQQTADMIIDNSNWEYPRVTYLR